MHAHTHEFSLSHTRIPSFYFVEGNVFVCFDPEAFETQAKKCASAFQAMQIFDKSPVCLDRYARAFQKVAKKWKSYGFVFFNVRDPVAKLLQMDCKEAEA